MKKQDSSSKFILLETWCFGCAFSCDVEDPRPCSGSADYFAKKIIIQGSMLFCIMLSASRNLFIGSYIANFDFGVPVEVYYEDVLL